MKSILLKIDGSREAEQGMFPYINIGTSGGRAMAVLTASF
jgi:hypothetical protein